MTKQQKIDELTTKCDMLKLELDTALKRISSFKNINEKLEEHINILNNSYEDKLEEILYNEFKQSFKARIIERFMKEYLKKNMSIDMNSDWGGTVKSEIKIGDETICSSNCSVITRNNPEEE